MPGAKLQHSVSVLDGLIYVMGGGDEDDNTLRSVHHFDLLANTWSAVAPMSVTRKVFGSFVLGRNIYVVGGSNSGEDMLSSMERYSVALEIWSEVVDGTLGQARDCFEALVVVLEVDFFDSSFAKAKSEGL
jgi:kelch-like protein 16 (gigaxonin)